MAKNVVRCFEEDVKEWWLDRVGSLGRILNIRLLFVIESLRKLDPVTQSISLRQDFIF